MLKTALLELPSVGSEVKRPAPATYTKVDFTDDFFKSILLRKEWNVDWTCGKNE